MADAITDGYNKGLSPAYPISWNRHIRDQIAIHEAFDIIAAPLSEERTHISRARTIARRRIAGLRARHTTTAKASAAH